MYFSPFFSQGSWLYTSHFPYVCPLVPSPEENVEGILKAYWYIGIQVHQFSTRALLGFHWVVTRFHQVPQGFHQVPLGYSRLQLGSTRILLRFSRLQLGFQQVTTRFHQVSNRSHQVSNRSNQVSIRFSIGFHQISTRLPLGSPIFT